MTDTLHHAHTPQELMTNISEVIFKTCAARAIDDTGLSSLIVPEGPFRDIIEYWDALDKKCKTPIAASFDLLALPQLVKNITIFEVDGGCIRIRFVGTNIVEETGEDTTGRYLDDMPNMSTVEDRAFRCTRTKQPYFHEDLPVTWTSRNFMSYSTLGLPLADQDGTVSQIAFLMIFN